MIYEAAIYDVLPMTDEVDSTTQIGPLEDVITLSDDIFSHRNFVSFSDRVTFDDTARVNSGCRFNVTLADSLTFQEMIDPKQHLLFYDYFQLIDWFEIPKGLLDDEVVFVEVMSGNAGPSMLDTITLVDALSYKLNVHLVSQDTITLTDGLSGFINNRWVFITEIVEERP